MTDEWWRGAVVYQVYPRSFRDGNGDGIGDLPGLVERLDYIASLGVDALWVCPFFRSPMRDFGYDVEDYREVDPLFGTMADADALIARAHGLGLKVIVDMVWSHSADTHPWFVESRASRTNPKADWYVWADPRPDGGPPNNWLSVFGGGAWSWEPRRRQYYLHHFLPAQPAFNWRCPDLAQAVLETGRFWLERGVDGFRLDAVDFLLHDAALRDNPPRPLAEIPAKPFGMQQHLYDMMQEGVLDIFSRIRALTDRFPGTTTIAELSSAGDPLARAGLYTAGRERLHSAYSLGLMRRPCTAAALRDTIAEAESKVGDGTLCWAFGNHDMERVASRWGDGSPDCARMLLALLISLRGSPCLYQGDELGLTEEDIPRERLRDPYGIAFWPDYKGRDGCRTPMPWRAEVPHAGFSAAEPWLPVPPAHRPRAVDRQEADGASPLNTLRRLLRWRKRHPALISGGLVLKDVHADVVAFERHGSGERVLCLFNPSPRPLTLPLSALPAEGAGYEVTAQGLRLDGWGAAFVLERE